CVSYGANDPKCSLFYFALFLGYSFGNGTASLECGKQSTNTENNLKNSLLCNGYRVDVRPRKDHTQTVNLTVAYYVLTYEFVRNSISIKESLFDGFPSLQNAFVLFVLQEEADNLMTLGVWLEMQWTDEFLRWNSTEWSGVERLAIDSNEIWIPDFRHFSSYYNPEEMTDCANPKCSVAPNGTVVCLPVCSMNAKCDADYSRWPFDVHRCNLWYGTWANSMDEIDVHILDVCLGKNPEFKSPKWSVVSLSTGRSVVQSSDNYMYNVLNVEVMLMRRASFEYVAVVAPILGLLNVYIVWLRSISFERKVLVGLSIFSHFAYIKQLEWALPYNRDTLPDCMIFMLCSTVLSVMLLILTLLNCWIRMRLNRESTTGSFIDRITGSFSQSRIAELILAADYLELSYKVLVTQEEKDNFWSRLGKLIDRAMAIVCVIVYIVLVWLFIPFNHELDELHGVNCVVSA
uniref:Neurotransmitter-gated ion-channel ligand-binding domain-containing protein n=1 Tax=Anopheles christyi TaxID=43041 RepID=A0A182K7A9_9DIPT